MRLSRPLRHHYALFKTTAFRLSIFYALVYSLLTTLTLALIYWSTTHFITRQVDEGLAVERNALIREYRNEGLSALVATVQRRAHDDLRGGHLWLVMDAHRHKLAGNFLAWPERLGLAAGYGYINLDSPSIEQSLRSDDDDIRVRTLAIPLENGALLLVGQALTNEDQLADHTLALVAWAVGILALITLVGGGFMGRAVLRRIESVSEAADAIMAGRLSERIAVTRKGDEFDDLVGRLNMMLARIDQLVGGMREVTDNVAHDLRSPLTRLRSRLEVAMLEPRKPEEYHEVIEGAVADLEGVIRTFNALLNIAQAEAGMQRKDFSPVDLEALTMDLGELYGPLAEEANLEFRFEGVSEAYVQGNRDLIAQAVGNLLENAIKYTPLGGHVHLRLARQEGRLKLSVRDTGPGIPQTDRLRVMERFVRLDTARSTPGNGLGLALVRAVAQLHDAGVTLEDAHPGLCVILDFPAI